MKFKDAPSMRESTLKRFLRQPHFDEHLELHRLDCLSSHRHLENYDFCVEKLSSLPVEELKPVPLVNGNDLIAAGYRPGPAFGKILAAVEDAQLESRIKTREEALSLVERLFEPPAGDARLIADS
jgi:poly(A) polymerase